MVALGGLAAIPFVVAVVLAVFLGNMVGSVLGGAIMIGFGLFIATWIAPAFTQVAVSSGFKLGEGQTVISSLVDGANPMTGLFMGAAALGTPGVLVLAVLCVAFVVGTKVLLDRRARSQLAAQTDAADDATVG